MYIFYIFSTLNRKYGIVFLFLFININLAQCFSVETEIIYFCKNNGYKYATFINFSSDKAPKIMSDSFLVGIRSRFVKDVNVKTIKTNHWDFLIIDFRNLQQKETIFNLISTHLVQRTLGIVENVQTFESVVPENTRNSLFFLFDEKYKWKQVLVINEQIVMNDIQLTKFGVAIVEENLQGLNIETISKTWSPVVFISDCNNEGLECNYEGLLVDLMTFWGKKLNFTWNLKQGEDWGMTPISGQV